MNELSDYVDLDSEPFAHLLPLGPGGAVTWQAIASFLNRDIAQHQGSRTSTTYVSPLAVVSGDVVLGNRCEVHAFSTVIGGTILGDDVIVGFGCEVVNSIIGSRTTLNHRATVGHALLGRNVHLAPGATLSSQLLDNPDPRLPTRPIEISSEWRVIHELGVPRFSAVLGDDVRIGSGALLGPGALIGRRSVIQQGVVLGSEVVGPDETVHNARPRAAGVRS